MRKTGTLCVVGTVVVVVINSNSLRVCTKNYNNTITLRYHMATRTIFRQRCHHHHRCHCLWYHRGGGFGRTGREQDDTMFTSFHTSTIRIQSMQPAIATDNDHHKRDNVYVRVNLHANSVTSGKHTLLTHDN